MLVIIGLMTLKRAQENGVSPWTAMIALSWTSALAFPVLTLLGGQIPDDGHWWEPATIGGLFLAGQFFTFLAIRLGDVSIAAPVQGVKVLLVPAAGTLILGEIPPLQIWAAAATAMAGIVCVQLTDATVDRSKILISVVFALLGAVSMTIFDLLIQSWAPKWGAGYFLPLAFGASAALALAFLPLADRPTAVRRADRLRPLLWGSVLMTLQAMGMTFTLARFGDATRVNIVYSLRGLWGVLLTWLFYSRLDDASRRPSNRVMTTRLLGAALIGVSVVLSVAWAAD